MIKTFNNKFFYFKYENPRLSFLITFDKRYFRLNRFHNGNRPIFQCYNYKKVYVTGFYHEELNEIIIYKMSTVNDRVDYTEKLNRYLFENPDPFRYDKMAERKALKFLEKFKLFSK